MRFLRKETPAVAAPPAPPQPTLDLVRFERLVEMGKRLHERGIDYDAIARRAAVDDISWNEALEAIDRELEDG